MDKFTKALLAGILGSMILAVTILALTGQDFTQLATFFAGTIIPTAIALFAADKAGKAANDSAIVKERTNGALQASIAKVVTEALASAGIVKNQGD